MWHKSIKKNSATDWASLKVHLSKKCASHKSLKRNSTTEVEPPKYRMSIKVYMWKGNIATVPLNTDWASLHLKTLSVPPETKDVLSRVKFQTSRIVFTIVGHPYHLTFYRQEQNHEWGWRETLWSNPYYCQSVCDSLHVRDIVTIITFQQSNHFLPNKQSMLCTQIVES